MLSPFLLPELLLQLATCEFTTFIIFKSLA